jgi:ABC-2 type transport system ATP-binding protein
MSVPPPEDMDGLRVEGLTLGGGAFGPARLRGVSLRLGHGVAALLGPNGSGKSTLMKVLAGVRAVDLGAVWWEGGPAEAEGLGAIAALVPQFPGAHAQLTVRQELERTASWTARRPATRRVSEALGRFGLRRQADVRGGHLTGSQRRRLALAAAWLRAAPLVLLDEPTAGMDAAERAELWTLVLALVAEEGAPQVAVVTTHLLEEVDAYCDQAVVMADGRCLYAGTTAELAERGGPCAFRRAGPDPPPGAVVIGQGPEGLDLWLFPPPAAADGLERRTPTTLDGYLATLAAAGEAP